MARSYGHMVDSTRRKLTVTDHLIEFENHTLQIRNLVGISTGRKTIAIKQPEPVFTQPPPTLDIPWGAALAASAIAWGFVWFMAWLWWLGLVLTAAAVCFGVYKARQRRTARLAAWQEQKDQIAVQWQAWDQLRRNPPVLFSLRIEANSGSWSLFHSFEHGQIEAANDAIKNAMKNKDVGDITLSIDTVEVAGDASIENIGSTIYNQTIRAS